MANAKECFTLLACEHVLTDRALREIGFSAQLRAALIDVCYSTGLLTFSRLPLKYPLVHKDTLNLLMTEAASQALKDETVKILCG